MLLELLQHPPGANELKAFLPKFRSFSSITNVHSLLNWLAPVRGATNFKSVIFNLIMLIIQNSNLDTRYEIFLSWILQNRTDEKSTLIQVMAWCCQATSHYLRQWWPRSVAIWRHQATMSNEPRSGIQSPVRVYSCNTGTYIAYIKFRPQSELLESWLRFLEKSFFWKIAFGGKK